jgi:hypothetical protein
METYGKNFEETETDVVAWLLDSSHRNENKEEVEESILKVMYISISVTNL